MVSEETALVTEAPAPPLPDFYTDPNSVLGDLSASWRYGEPPDYSKTRKVFAETKKMNHIPGSLPQLVENLVKNWEIEASFKTTMADWRTVNHSRYTFSMNGGTPQKAEHMLNVGTYNAIIAPNEFYDPANSDFASSHKTFKRMMPFFAWEVLEVYSGPPKVAFRWRHWGDMKNDYVGFNNRGEKITAQAHGGSIDVQGITVADLDDDLKIVHIETWFDPMEIFRQIAPEGIVNKQPVHGKPSNPPDDTERTAEFKVSDQNGSQREIPAVLAISSPDAKVTEGENKAKPSEVEITSEVKDAGAKPYDAFDSPQIEDAQINADEGVRQVDSAESEAQITVKLDEGEAVAVSVESGETILTHEKMNATTLAQCPFMTRE